MSEKFEGFKDKLIADNEKRYGKETRKRYGDKAMDASNAKVKAMTENTMQEAEALSERINAELAKAFAGGDPAGALAQSVCELHRRWLCLYWPDGMYSKQAHAGLADMYAEDERFRAYYDRIAPGCTEFLRQAIHIYCGQ